MKTLALSSFVILTSILSFAQESISYQKPPKEILDLVDVERAPSVMMDSKKQNLVYQYSPMYKTIEEVSEPELKLAGQRINPQTNMVSGARYTTKVTIQLNRAGEPKMVQGFPANAKLVNLTWSPDEQSIACGNIVSTGVELWVIDVKTQIARRLSDATLNANLGSFFNWFADSKSLLVHVLPSKPVYRDAVSTVPFGPTVSVSDG